MKYYMCKNNKQLQKNLQVGNRVKIISKQMVNKITASGYGFMFGFNRNMLEYCGKEFVIREKEKSNSCYDDGTRTIKFYLAGIEKYVFSVEMFDLTNLPVLLENE